MKHQFSSHGHTSAEDRLERRDAANERVATHDTLVARFGEHLANSFCEACGTSMTKYDDFGELYCDIMSCDMGRRWWDSQEEEAA